MAKQPEAYNFEDLQDAKINDKPNSILDVEEALAVVVMDERRRRISSRDSGLGAIKDAKDANVALADVTSCVSVDCIVAYVTGFFDFILEMEERELAGGDGVGNVFFEVARNRLDKLFSDFCKHPDYACAHSLLDAEEDQQDVAGGTAWQRIHESAIHLFSNKSKV